MANTDNNGSRDASEYSTLNSPGNPATSTDEEHWEGDDSEDEDRLTELLSQLVADEAKSIAQRFQLIIQSLPDALITRHRSRHSGTVSKYQRDCDICSRLDELYDGVYRSFGVDPQQPFVQSTKAHVKGLVSLGCHANIHEWLTATISDRMQAPSAAQTQSSSSR